MGKVEDPHNSKCQRKPNSQQSIYASQEKATDKNLNHFIIALILQTWILVLGGGNIRWPDNVVLPIDDLGWISVDGSHTVF